MKKGVENGLLFAACGGLLLGTLLLALLMRYHKQTRNRLLKCLSWFKKGKNNENTQRENARPLLQEKRSLNRVRGHFSTRTVPASSVGSRIDNVGDSNSYPRPPTLFMNEDPVFTVPLVSQHPVQPKYDANYNKYTMPAYRPPCQKILSRQATSPQIGAFIVNNGESPASSATDWNSNHTTIRPALGKTISTPLLALNLDQIQEHRRLHDFSTSKCISDDELTDKDSLKHFNFVQPELYRAIRRRTLGSGDLGKVLCSLKYKDDTKRTLSLTVHRIRELQPFRVVVGSVYINIIMLPDRESIHHTRSQSSIGTNIKFEDSFDFPSKPLNRDFESKTIRFVVRSIDKDEKESNYGEARIPLLSYEIYSQIPTDISLNIAPLQEEPEIADILIQLIYNPDPGNLSITLKTLKFPSPAHLANITGIEIRSSIKRDRHHRTRKNSLILPVLHGHTNSVSIEIDNAWQFSIPKEEFKKYTFKISVKGKHRVLSKKLSLGKILMGEKSCDEAGELHWQIAYKSPGVSWTMWHPVYGC